MSDEKMVTEREAVERERKAYQTGVANERSGIARFNTAAQLYPLPKVTRPRVVFAFDAEWRVVNGELEYRDQFTRSSDDGWVAARSQWSPTSARVALWADLFANATEEVDA